MKVKILFLGLGLSLGQVQTASAQTEPARVQTSSDTIQWGVKTVVNDVAPDSNCKYGSQYARMLQLKDGNWLMGYTVARQKRYDRNVPYGPEAAGGLELEVSRSMDEGGHWAPLAVLTDPGRDLDNAQLIETTDGAILLSCRSVRWQESYILRVYISRDKGRHWDKWSVIDSTAGAPGALGHPDKGIYEPHFYYLADGRLAVQYANEKHVVENPSYSQIISVNSAKRPEGGNNIQTALGTMPR